MSETDVLVLEDEKGISDLVAETLQDAGMDVYVSSSCAHFRAERRRRSFDLYVLDVALPDGNGLDIAREIRVDDPYAGIIVLSGRGDEVDTVVGLELGADDYVAKPFRGRELQARVRSLLRRIGAGARSPNECRSLPQGDRYVPLGAGWILDTFMRSVIDEDGSNAQLSPTEYCVLEFIVTQAPRPVTREQIVRHVRGPNWTANDRFVDGIVSRLRRKLRMPSERPLRTIKGVGYAFDGGVIPDRK